MKKKLKMTMALLLAFVFALFIPQTAAAEETYEETETFKIVHTNDVHASITNYDHLKTFLDAERAAGPVLYFDAGDNFSGAPIVDYFQGKPTIELLNTLGLDALTLGNHEFDYGQEQLEARRQEANFPWLGANIEIAGDTTYPLSPFEGYHVFDVDGIKVGVVGIVQAPPATKLSGLKGLDFKPYVETMKKYEFLRDEVDVLVALTHIGLLDDERLAEEVNFFDLIIGGHSHTAIAEPKIVNGTPIVQAGEKLKNIGEVTVDVTSIYEESTTDSSEKELVDKKVKIAGKLLPMTDIVKEYPADPTVKAQIEGYQKAVDDQLNVRIGHTKNKLNRDNRWEEDSAMGNMITDALKAFGGTDIAITNNGGIRDSIEAGDITKADIFRVDPFDNEIAILKMPGRVLKELIEFSFHRADKDFGYTIVDISSSGLTYTIYYDGPEGKNTPREKRKLVVADLMVNGEPVEDDKIYSVTTNAFLADGGDGYTMFEKADWDKNTYHGKVTEAIIQYIEDLDKKGEALDYASTAGRNVVKHISERPEQPGEAEEPETDELMDRIKALEAKIAALEADHKVLKTQLAAIKEELAAIKKELHTKEANLTELQEKIDHCKEKVMDCVEKEVTTTKPNEKKEENPTKINGQLPKAGEVIKNNAPLIIGAIVVGGAILYFTCKKDNK